MLTCLCAHRLDNVLESVQVGEYVHEIERQSVYTKAYDEVHQMLLAGQSCESVPV